MKEKFSVFQIRFTRKNVKLGDANTFTTYNIEAEPTILFSGLTMRAANKKRDGLEKKSPGNAYRVRRDNEPA